MFYIQLISYFTLTFIINLLLFSKKNIFITVFKKFFLSFLGLYGFLNIISFATKGSTVDSDVIINLLEPTNFQKTLEAFFIPTLSMFIVITLYLVSVLFFEKKINAFLSKILRQPLGKIGIFILLLFTFLPNNNIFLSLKNNLSMVSFKETNLEDTLENLGIDPDTFIEKEDLEGIAGKNVVIIYLESLEKNWMDTNLFDGEDLTPNLRNFSKSEDWNFFENYTSLPGSTWTFGAQYSSLTGIPTMFGYSSNNIFHSVTSYSGISVGDVLKKAGYNQVYMNGAHLDYSGKGNLFQTFGYETYGEAELPKEYPREIWGVKDKDLFKEAKKQYLELSKKEAPFNLTLLTVDIHFPKGFPDKRLEDRVPRENLSGLEYSVKTTDYLVNDFIEFMKKQPNYEDTIIFILPDHRLMGNKNIAPEITNLLESENRDLFLLTNSKSLEHYDKSDEITLYDLPRIILDGIDVETNVKFLNELNPDLEIHDKVVEKNIQNLNLNLIEEDENIRNEMIRNNKLKAITRSKTINKFIKNFKDTEDLAIFLSTKGDLSNFSDTLSPLGLKKDLTSYSYYIAVVHSNGKVYEEVLSSKELQKNIKLEVLKDNLKIVSGSQSSILIDKIEFSNNQGGINIVIYDLKGNDVFNHKNNKNVIDLINIDSNLKINRSEKSDEDISPRRI